MRRRDSRSRTGGAALALHSTRSPARSRSSPHAEEQRTHDRRPPAEAARRAGPAQHPRPRRAGPARRADRRPAAPRHGVLGAPARRAVRRLGHTRARGHARPDAGGHGGARAQQGLPGDRAVAPRSGRVRRDPRADRGAHRRGGGARRRLRPAGGTAPCRTGDSRGGPGRRPRRLPGGRPPLPSGPARTRREPPPGGDRGPAAQPLPACTASPGSPRAASSSNPPRSTRSCSTWYWPATLPVPRRACASISAGCAPSGSAAARRRINRPPAVHRARREAVLPPPPPGGPLTPGGVRSPRTGGDAFHHSPRHGAFRAGPEPHRRRCTPWPDRLERPVRRILVRCPAARAAPRVGNAPYVGQRSLESPCCAVPLAAF